MRPHPPKTSLGRRPPAVVLFIISVLLYAAPFVWRSPLAPYLSFVALIPAFELLARTKPGWAALQGALAGAAIFGLVCPWLAAYHLGAILFVIGLEATWFSVAFASISAVLRTRSRFSIPAAVFTWAVIDIGRSVGFLAFPYGSLPYSLAYSRAALVLASIGGVPLVGLAIAGANASFLAAIRRFQQPGTGRFAAVAKRAVLGTVCVVFTLAAGKAPATAAVKDGRQILASVKPESPLQPGWFRVALIQPAVMEQESVSDYSAGFKRIASLSEEALDYNPDLVAWYETAIVPPIDWHLRHRPDRDTYEFVSGVDDFIAAFPAPLLVGNGYAPPDDLARSVEYNSAVLYEGGRIEGRYDKVKLVPFTEYFPYEKLFPGLTRWLIDKFGYFWTPGPGPTILASGKSRFAAPICFEDSFGRYMASFDAPDFYIVQTNDSWAKSASMQEQHLAMSIFRATETGAILLRVANTGSTAVIAPNGHVVASLPPFEPGTLLVDIPLGSAVTTLYESGGKNVDIAILCIALALVILSGSTRGTAFRIDNNDIV